MSLKMRISFLNFQTLSSFLRYAAIGILPLSPLFRKTVFHALFALYADKPLLFPLCSARFKSRQRVSFFITLFTFKFILVRRSPLIRLTHKIQDKSRLFSCLPTDPGVAAMLRQAPLRKHFDYTYVY